MEIKVSTIAMGAVLFLLLAPLARKSGFNV